MEDTNHSFKVRDGKLVKYEEISSLLKSNESSASSPYSFEFNDSKNHLYFLSNVKDQKNIKNIHYIDMNTDSKEIKALFNYVDNNVELSLEDQLQRERQRVAANGITQFTFDQKHQLIVAPINNRINIIEGSIENPKLKEISGETYNHQLSADGKLVSFLKEKDIWITDIESNKMYQITFSNDNHTNKFKYAGDVGFVYAEEFSRYTGYWWSPIISIDEKTGNPLYSILYLEEDETDVIDFHIPDQELKGKTTLYKYPLTGEKNSTSKVCLVQFSLSPPSNNNSNNNNNDDGSTSSSSIEIVKSDLFDLKIQFPWYEYITRAGWLPNGESIWLQLLDRKQQHLALVVVPLKVFKQSPNTVTKLPVLIEETTKVWINIEFSFHFFSSSKNKLIWSNEQTGYRHLYLITWESDDSELIYSNIKSTPITLDTDNNNNNWMVSSDDIYVDEKKNLVYFSGTKDDCLEQHLYVTSFDGNFKSGNIKRLSSPNHSHKSIKVSNDFKKFISTFSNLSTPSKTQVFDLIYDDNNDGSTTLPNVKPSFLVNDNTQKTDEPQVVSPKSTIFNFKSSKGNTIYGQYTLPVGYDPNNKYPTVVYIYGGPHVMIVQNQYKMVKQNYAHFGFVQVMIDNVGSANRGLEFEGKIQYKMGQVEIQDQFEGIMHLIDNDIVSIDQSRIAIQGWSYGGYLSLIALGQKPDFFKIAISGAPVTDWLHYNTGYTERYMGLPNEQSEAYKLGSVSNYVNNYPNEENRLILIHGAQDENVHLTNTIDLISHLTTNKKPYIFKLLPNERHGMRKDREYIELFIINHLLKYL